LNELLGGYQIGVSNVVPAGRLDKALDEAQVQGWRVIDIKRYWKAIYQFEKEK